MRWRSNVNFAWLPHHCYCGHTVWLEKYTYCGDKMVMRPIPVDKCQHCKPIEKEEGTPQIIVETRNVKECIGVFEIPFDRCPPPDIQIKELILKDMQNGLIENMEVERAEDYLGRNNTYIGRIKVVK